MERWAAFPAAAAAWAVRTDSAAALEDARWLLDRVLSGAGDTTGA